MKIPDEYVKELVHDIAADRGVNLVFLIKERQNVSEFKIAEKLGLTVNEVRNVLYRLQDKNLVFFTRKKDKKKGWYVYFWTFDMPKARDLILERKQEQQAELQRILKEETQGNVYVCPNKCVRANAELALEYHFKCPECDAVLIEENVEKRTEKTHKELEKLGVEIDEVSKIQKPLPPPEPEKKPIKKRPKIPPKKPLRKQVKKVHHKPIKKILKHPKHKPSPHPQR